MQSHQSCAIRELRVVLVLFHNRAVNIRFSSYASKAFVHSSSLVESRDEETFSRTLSCYSVPAHTTIIRFHFQTNVGSCLFACCRLALLFTHIAVKEHLSVEALGQRRFSHDIMLFYRYVITRTTGSLRCTTVLPLLLLQFGGKFGTIPRRELRRLCTFAGRRTEGARWHYVWSPTRSGS